jgi:FKBP-type peptidyl-prolyl cis-trans isomerase FklB
MGRIPRVLVTLSIAAALIWAMLPSPRPTETAATAADDGAPAPGSKAGLATQKQKQSYAFGHKVASNMREKLGPEAFDLDAFLLGVKEGLSGKGASLSEGECEQAFKTFQQELGSRQMKTANAAADKNKKEGEAFLAANKNKPGVQTLPSGIQYIVLKDGTGKQPKATDEVKVHYHGTLINGTVFDSSVDRGEPATFRLNEVIAGWTESVQKMKEGSKWRVFIPPDLAYGPRGPASIGPNATLIFEIELLKVN